MKARLKFLLYAAGLAALGGPAAVAGFIAGLVGSYVIGKFTVGDPGELPYYWVDQDDAYDQIMARVKS